MKVTYEFEKEDEGERKIFENASGYHSALWDIYQTIRTYQRYGEGDPDDILSQVSELVFESGVMEV